MLSSPARQPGRGYRGYDSATSNRKFRLPARQPIPMASPQTAAARPDRTPTACARSHATTARANGASRRQLAAEPAALRAAGLALGPTRRIILSAWLLLAMVLAQTMGFVHGTAHDPRHRAASSLPQASAAASAGVAAIALERLFDHHEDDTAQCRLYDQMGRGDCTPTADIASLSSLPAATAPTASTTPWLCSTCLPARARGPPLAG